MNGLCKKHKYCIIFQLMETGEVGLLGVRAARPVEVEHNPEHVSVTIQPQQMAEQLVWAVHLNLKHAIHKHV
jgi:hypothetical protein